MIRSGKKTIDYKYFMTPHITKLIKRVILEHLERKSELAYCWNNKEIQKRYFYGIMNIINLYHVVLSVPDECYIKFQFYKKLSY